MTPQHKGIIPPDALARLLAAQQLAEDARQVYVQAVVMALAAGGSYSEIHLATGASTNTLQRWMRDAGVKAGGRAERDHLRQDAELFDARIQAAEAALAAIQRGLSHT